MRIPLPNRDSLRHWPILAEAVLWMVLLFQLARFGWLLFAPASIAGAPRLTMLPAEIPALAGHDPFFGGNAPATTAGLEGWTLFGLRLGADGEGTAILGRDGQPQAAYRVGDELVPGLALAAVAADHVALGNGQRLDLPDAAPAATPAPAAPTTAAAAAPAGAPGLDPARLLDAGLQARSEDGRITGYTLLPRGNSELLLRAAGLQPGDVLLTVNGRFLSPTVMAELAHELKSDPRAVVTFERDGQTRTLHLGSGTP